MPVAVAPATNVRRFMTRLLIGAYRSAGRTDFRPRPERWVDQSCLNLHPRHERVAYLSVERRPLGSTSPRRFKFQVTAMSSRTMILGLETPQRKSSTSLPRR